MRLTSILFVLISVARPTVSRPYPPSPNDVCEVRRADVRSWRPTDLGPLLALLPPDVQADTGVSVGLEFHHGGARWRRTDLTVEWHVSHRAYLGVMFDSMEQSLARVGLPDARIAGCVPTVPTGWFARTTVDSTTEGLRLSLAIMQPAPRDEIFHVVVTARTPRARATAVTILRKLRAPPNMRLKLSGLLLKESAVASPGGFPGGGPVPCAGAHAARSLSAIR